MKWLDKTNRPFTIALIGAAAAIASFEFWAGRLMGINSMEDRIAVTQQAGDVDALRAARQAIAGEVSRLQEGLGYYAAQAAFASRLMDRPAGVEDGLVLENGIHQVAVEARNYAYSLGTTVEGEISFGSRRNQLPLEQGLAALAIADGAIRLAADCGVSRIRIERLDAARRPAGAQVEISLSGPEPAIWRFMAGLATRGRFLVAREVSMEMDKNRPNTVRVNKLVLGTVDGSGADLEPAAKVK